MDCPVCYEDYNEHDPCEKFAEGYKHGEHFYLFTHNMTSEQRKIWEGEK